MRNTLDDDRSPHAAPGSPLHDRPSKFALAQAPQYTHERSRTAIGSDATGHRASCGAPNRTNLNRLPGLKKRIRPRKYHAELCKSLCCRPLCPLKHASSVIWRSLSASNQLGLYFQQPACKEVEERMTWMTTWRK